MSPAASCAFVLAAGRGERLRPLTDKTPKPLLPLAGRSILERIFVSLKGMGVKKVVLNACYKSEQIIEFAEEKKSYFEEGISVSLETELLGTGGGLRRALPLIGEVPFWMINGDIFFELAPSVFHPEPSAELCWWLVEERPDQTLIGVEESRVHSIGGLWASSPSPAKRFCYSGIQLIQHLEPSELPEKGCFIRDYLISRLRRGSWVQAHTGGLSQWEDLGTVERLERVASRL